jgi:UPF0176 protein
MSGEIRVLAYYCFTQIEEPGLEVKKHQDFFSTRDVKARIYISSEGINGQMSAGRKAAEEYMNWLRSDPRFKEIDFKIHLHHEHVFPRCTVKEREQIVALDRSVDPKKGGQHLPPAIWRRMLAERDADTLLLDVRNDYEWELGHFEGAELPRLNTFREFPAYAQELREKRDPEKIKVMMYCTGGIRCELYSAFLKEVGFAQVYQLQGGIIRYGLEEGSAGWLGKLFVFDDRLSISISPEADSPTISNCRHCGSLSQHYHNCANMDCNELFLSCLCCAKEYRGCCSADCMTAPRLRPYIQSESPKPFRRQSCENHQ